MPLKYLFRCQFNDGGTFHQNKEDQSEYIATKSSFYDLLRYEKTCPVKDFTLTNVEDATTYLVNLEDGHFEINGSSFFLHEQTVDKTKTLSNFRLIYFRRVQQSLNLATGEESDNTTFIIGWQANYPDGSNHKQIMYIR